MVVPAKAVACGLVGRTRGLQPLAKGNPARGIGRAVVGHDKGAIKPLHLQRSGDGQNLFDIGFQLAQPEVAGGHGKPGRRKARLRGCHRRIISVQRTIAFNGRVPRLGQHLERGIHRREVARRVKLIAEHCQAFRQAP